MEIAQGMSKNICNSCNARKEKRRENRKARTPPPLKSNVERFLGDTDWMSNLAAVYLSRGYEHTGYLYVRERKTHKHKQICRMVPGLGGYQKCVSGHSLRGRKHINKIPQIPEQSREAFVHVFFLYVFFLLLNMLSELPCMLPNQGER